VDDDQTVSRRPTAELPRARGVDRRVLRVRPRPTRCTAPTPALERVPRSPGRALTEAAG